MHDEDTDSIDAPSQPGGAVRQLDDADIESFRESWSAFKRVIGLDISGPAKAWHISLICTVFLAFLIPFYVHMVENKTHDESSLCTMAWEMIVIFLSALLTIFYYYSIFFSDKINPAGKSLGFRLTGETIVWLLLAIVSLALAFWAALAHSPILIVLFLFLATACYFVCDLRGWSRCRERAKQLSEELANSKVDASEVKIERRRTTTYRRSTLYANIPTLVGLAAILLYSSAHYLANSFELGDMSVFIGGAAAMHVVYGDLVIGFIMATEKAME